jgi:uncharacterized protein (DUF885 family)
VRTLRLVTVILLAAGLLTLSAEAAQSKKKAASLDDLGADILSALQAFNPVHATEMGIHAYDAKFTDYSPNSVKDMVKRLQQFDARLDKFEKQTLSDHDRVDLRLLRSDVRVLLADLSKIEWYRKSPQLYVDEALNGIYFLVLSEYAPMDKKLPAILGRMRQVPALFTTARGNIKKPPAILVQLAKSSLDDAMEFYRQIANDLAKQFPNRANEIIRTATAAREAMNDFQTAIGDMPTGDDKSFAIGETNFNYLLANEYFMDITADSLLKLGQVLLDSAQGEYAAFEKVVETSRQIGQDSVFAPKSFTRQDILDYYNWEANQVKTYLKMNGIITVPDDVAELKVVETPPVLRSMISGIAYQPAGPFDPPQPGHFYVRPIPDSLDRTQLDARYRYVQRRGFKGSVVHEGFPGHHLQMQLAAHNPDPIRKWQMNTMMEEGWALYSEEMMYRAGLYGMDDPSQWLGVLGGIRFRAARIVADVKLHTGQFTYDECVEWMTKTLGAETESAEQYVRKEVQRYTYTPTIQMSYLMGKREIERLRDAAQKRDGSDFSEHKFYDALMAEGSIPPTLMWGIMRLSH